MNNLLRTGFQPVSETEMLMVEGGTGDNGPQKGKDPLYILDGDGEYTPPPPPSNGGGCGDVNWVEMR